MISILSILVVLVIIGFALWLINFMPLEVRIKQIITGIVIFLVVIYILQALLGGTPVFNY